MASENSFHPNPQVRRMRESMTSHKPESQADGHAEGSAPAKAVEIHRHEDGSYHSITHQADGKKEKKEHASHQEAVDHQHQAFGEEAGDGMDHMGGDDGLQAETQEPCPDCGGEGCESCGGTGMKKSGGEEY